MLSPLVIFVFHSEAVQHFYTEFFYILIFSHYRTKVANTSKILVYFTSDHSETKIKHHSSPRRGPFPLPWSILGRLQVMRPTLGLSGKCL